jgi:hypothetical protein
VGVRRLEADAKYSSLKERTWAPRTVVLRFVVAEKVLSISEEGIGVTISDSEVDAVGKTTVSWIVSGESDWTSIAFFIVCNSRCSLSDLEMITQVLKL